MIRIISYNVHFGKKLPKITAWLSDLQPYDIYCFQEFPEDRIKNFVHALPGSPRQWRFAPALRIRKKTFGELTVIANTRIRIQSSSILPLHVNKMEKLVLGQRSERSCILTVCTFARKKFIIANIQLACVASTAVRHMQIDKIIAALAKEHIRKVIFIGDFNSWTISERKGVIKYMKLRQFETHESRTATHRIAIYKHQLDFIFGKQCAITDVRVDRVRFSDHYPVHAVIVL